MIVTNYNKWKRINEDDGDFNMDDGDFNIDDFDFDSIDLDNLGIDDTYKTDKLDENGLASLNILIKCSSSMSMKEIETLIRSCEDDILSNDGCNVLMFTDRVIYTETFTLVDTGSDTEATALDTLGLSVETIMERIMEAAHTHIKGGATNIKSAYIYMDENKWGGKQTIICTDGYHADHTKDIVKELSSKVLNRETIKFLVIGDIPSEMKRYLDYPVEIIKR